MDVHRFVLLCVDAQSRFKGMLVSLVLLSVDRSCKSSVALQLMRAPESALTGVNLNVDRTELEPGSPTMLCRTASPLSQ